MEKSSQNRKPRMVEAPMSRNAGAAQGIQKQTSYSTLAWAVQKNAPNLTTPAVATDTSNLETDGVAEVHFTPSSTRQVQEGCELHSWQLVFVVLYDGDKHRSRH